MEYSSIIVAAGSGNRLNLGYNKLLYKIKDKTIIEMTVDVFLSHSKCKEVILVCSENDISLMKDMFKDKVKYVLGGKTRSESVCNGLASVNYDYVYIHDGARPYITCELLDKVNSALIDNDAICLCVPVKDTIKYVVDDTIVSTPKRDQIHAAQTPQAFKTNIIKDAYKNAINYIDMLTDDSSVVEQFSNTNVKVVIGDYSNIKITTKEDLK